MQDLLSLISMRKRPPLLVQAARFGVDVYNRRGRLPRILNCSAAPRVGEAIVMLLDCESDLEERRIAKAADYTIASHVDVLTALLAEARLLQSNLATRIGAAPETKMGPQVVPCRPVLQVVR